MTVIIQPSLGNVDARRNWESTIVAPVPLGRVVQALSPEQRARLERLHPSGEARFWGMTAGHDKAMAEVDTGDVVLFTGRNHVQGVGEVGFVTRSARLGDLLWPPHGERGSYDNVYSLRFFQFTRIPYQEIWDLPSFNVGDNFQGARFLRGEKASEIIEGLQIATATGAEAAFSAGKERVERARSHLGLVPDEAMNVDSTTYERSGGLLTVNRFEAQLVAAYRRFLGVQTGRLRTPAGVTDMAIESAGGIEVVEAKSSADRFAVRTAIGQLFDYCSHLPRSTTMTILLPGEPDPDLVRLTVGLGVSVVYLRDDGAFVRREGSPSSRETIYRLLRPEGGSP